MQYRQVGGHDPLSILGFGCMRLPKSGAKIDLSETEREIRRAVDSGVNYFDAAYTYPGIEEALGTVVQRIGCRDKIKIATKLPHYLLKTSDDLDKYFNTELERLKTDHVDYYLMHMLPDVAVWERLKKLGIEKWIEDKKASGQIRNIGFSYHGNSVSFCEVLDCYNWDFCQIQYNYMDETTQAGRKGLEYAASKNIPVIIMEPLRGGRLVDHLPKKASSLFRKYAPTVSPAEWAFRWIWDQPGPTVVLSGMNSMTMLEENLRVANTARVGELTEDDHAFLAEIKELINEKVKVQCTGCGYCMPCPNDVDIPGCFNAYNIGHTDNYYEGIKNYIMCTVLRNKKSGADLCVKCGKCRPHCPQGIDIPEELVHVNKYYGNFICRFIDWIICRMYKY